MVLLVDAHGDVAIDDVSQSQKWSLDVDAVGPCVKLWFGDDANYWLAGGCSQREVVLKGLHLDVSLSHKILPRCQPFLERSCKDVPSG